MTARHIRWQAPDGRVITVPLPAGTNGHFGPELRRYVLMQYHQGQTTVERLLDQLHHFGIVISKRQLVRLLTQNQDIFIDEGLSVLRAGLLCTASWITVDDTGARHKGKRFLYPDRQRRLRLVPEHWLQKPHQLSGGTAGGLR